jgi:hypothetical protein
MIFMGAKQVTKEHENKITKFVAAENLHVEASCGAVHNEYSIVKPHCYIDEGNFIIVSSNNEARFISILIPCIASVKITAKMCIINYEGGMVTFYKDYYDTTAIFPFKEIENKAYGLFDIIIISKS